MRTRGSKDQQNALKSAPKKQLDKVFEVSSDAVMHNANFEVIFE